MSGPEREHYRDGAVGFMAEDHATGAWYWSVRWPGHACPNRSCIRPPSRQAFRLGHASTRREAIEAADAAHASGHPGAGEGYVIP